MTGEDFDVGNATFKIVYVAPAGYIASCRTQKPAVAVLTGFIITGMAVAYFWLLTGRVAAVERTVADRWLELRERERYIRHLVDNTSDAIFLCDQQGTILDVNRHAYESLGYRREELLSMTVDDVELPAGGDDATPLPKLAADDHPQDFEAVHLRKDGTTFPVEVHVTSVGIGQQQLRLAIVRDITDRKRAEGTLST
jgi:PAS domain S-box-containing protein